ncbi:hypothetical protein [Halopiger xanaduensis]|uniref:Uncharacterized protein n=1 Tax=Halopiger xanaduensis (strain DSM 18323 / JCM 14033 / SH-6) TaxID=797210 RepID=F8D5M2_HALXS|nr:hypothetical protein [Halopiger xanaduensis]AEH38861.1 hypothetical protein Halxa_4259 [Halopiger xanaduensis SH-6]
MDLDDYLQEKESVVARVEAYDDKDAMTDHRKGELAVTPNRVVFVRNKVVSDISLNGVDSIEYRAPSYPYRYLYWAGGCFGFAALFFILGKEIDPIAQFSGLLGFTAVFAGIVLLVTGLFLKRAMLSLHTSNATFEFVSKDNSLAAIAHALRGHENR